MLSSAFRHDRVHHAHNVASMTVRMGGDAKAVGGSGRPLSPAVAARVAVKTTVPDGAVPRHLRPSMPQRTTDGHATHHFSSCSGGKKNPPCGKMCNASLPVQRELVQDIVCNTITTGSGSLSPRIEDMAFLSVGTTALVGRRHSPRRQRRSKHSAHNDNSHRHRLGAKSRWIHEAWRGSPIAA